MQSSNSTLSKFNNIEINNDVERLIVLRKRLGNMKQYELARELGVSASYIVAIENFRQPFTNNFKKKLDQFLKRLELEQFDYENHRLF